MLYCYWTFNRIQRPLRRTEMNKIHSAKILTSHSLSTLESALFGMGLNSPDPVISAQSFLVESKRDALIKSFFVMANIQYDVSLPNVASFSLESHRKTYKLLVEDTVDTTDVHSANNYKERHNYGVALHIRMMNQVQYQLFKHLCEQEILPLIILESLVLNPETFELNFDTQTLSITPFSHYFENVKLPRLRLIEQTMKFLKANRELSFTCNAISDFKDDESVKTIFNDYALRRFKPYSSIKEDDEKFYNKTEMALRYVLKETCYELMLNTHNRESHETKIFSNFIYSNSLGNQNEGSNHTVNQLKFTPLYFNNALELLSKLESQNQITHEDSVVYSEILIQMKQGLEMLATCIDQTAHYYSTP